MRFLKAIAFFGLVGSLCAGSGFSQARGRTQRPQGLALEADRLLRELVSHHPRVEISRELNGWVESGKIYISMQTDRMPDEMSVELVSGPAGVKPALVVNPGFLMRSTSFDLKRDIEYKRAVIYHEYWHVKLHFTGEIPLRPSELLPGETVASRANHLWDVEYRAVWEEWKYVRDRGVPYLMPLIQESVNRYRGKEHLGFLEAFYRVISLGKTVSDPAINRPFWEARYKKEKVKLLSKRAALPRAARFH